MTLRRPKRNQRLVREWEALNAVEPVREGEESLLGFVGAVFGRLSTKDVEPGECFDVIKVVPDPAPKSVDENVLGGFTSGTSRKAAVDHFPRSGTLRRDVLEAVGAAKERGATSDELADAHGWRLYSVKPRLTELRRGGWVEQNGTRPSATGSDVDVYVLTPKGQREIENPGSTEGPA